jgi:hypothetical protein
MSELNKSSDRHRQRVAVVHVRQSTPGQVDRNTESAARQHALAERRNGDCGRCPAGGLGARNQSDVHETEVSRPGRPGKGVKRVSRTLKEEECRRPL